MEVEILRSRDELEETKPFRVETLLWGTKKIPETFGYLGYVPGEGFYLKMVCVEKDPLRTYIADQDPVYQDSAMEAFLQFESAREREDSPIYMNFEVNANGALLAGYGTSRIYRSYFSKEDLEEIGCRAAIEDDRWSFTLKIPQRILESVYGPIHLEEGSKFRCNFYKICETASNEHYASYSPVLSEIPSFHLPEFFASAKLVKREQ